MDDHSDNFAIVFAAMGVSSLIIASISFLCGLCMKCLVFNMPNFGVFFNKIISIYEQLLDGVEEYTVIYQWLTDQYMPKLKAEENC